MKVTKQSCAGTQQPPTPTNNPKQHNNKLTLETDSKHTMSRLDAFVAQARGLSRGTASNLVLQGKVKVNGETTTTKSFSVQHSDIVTLEDELLSSLTESCSLEDANAGIEAPRNEALATSLTEAIGSSQGHGSAANVEACARGKDPAKKIANIYCIDVECVATGRGHRDRTPARVVMVNEFEDVVFDQHIKPTEPVVSCLTQLTGIVQADLESASPLEAVREELAKVLPKTATLIGQGIKHDIEWMGLQQGVHYADEFDIAQLFALRYPNGRYRYYSLRHEVLHLSGFEGAGSDIQAGVHDPQIDALYSIRLFNRYHSASETELNLKRQALARAPATLNFSKLCPMIDGVAMGPPARTSPNPRLGTSRKLNPSAKVFRAK